MTADDSDPDDRRDESADDHSDGEPADDAEHDSTDVPIDESSSSDDAGDGGSTEDADPTEGGRPGEGDIEDRRAGGRNAEDERPRDRKTDDSRVGIPSGSDAGKSGTGDREAGGSGGNWLSSLLSALESLDSGSTSGRRQTDRTVVDYDISVRSGDDIVDESRRDRRSISGGGPDRDRRAESESSRSRTRRRRSPSNAHHLTTRETDDELIVTADVASADPDDVTVGFDDSTLVVAVDGSELDRVDVPWRERTAEATIKNGILTVAIEPGELEDEPDEDTDDSRPDSNTGGGE